MTVGSPSTGGGPSVITPLSTKRTLFGMSLHRQPREKYKRADVVAGYLFVLVPLLIFITFTFGAMIYDFWISFHHWDVLTTPRANGTANYSYLLKNQDGVWFRAIENTVEYSVIVVPIQTAIAFVLALIVNQPIRAKKFFRTVFYFPSVTSSVAISVLFLWLFNDLGLINYGLGKVGIPGVGWLSDPNIALKSIMGLNIWTTTGTYMIIFLAALQDVPQEMLEAASIDGATGWTATRRITIPLIRPAIFFIVATGLIGTLQIFDQAYVLSGGVGGPNDSTMTAVLYIYRNAFVYSFYGVAAAASFSLFAFIFVATLLVRRFFGEGAA